MVSVLISISVILFAFGFFTFDEEGLIILSSFLWIDAAAGLFKTLLDSELLHKVEVIRSKFIWYISLKKALLLELSKIYNSRLHFSSALNSTNQLFLITLARSAITLSVENLRIRRMYESRVWVLNLGTAVHHSKLIKNLENGISISSFSGTLGRNGQTKLVPNFYKYSTLLHLIV